MWDDQKTTSIDSPPKKISVGGKILILAESSMLFLIFLFAISWIISILFGECWFIGCIPYLFYAAVGAIVATILSSRLLHRLHFKKQGYEKRTVGRSVIVSLLIFFIVIILGLLLNEWGENRGLWNL